MKPEIETYKELSRDKDAGIKLLFERYAKRMETYAKYKWKIGQDPAWDMVYSSVYKAAEVSRNYTFESEQKFASFLFRIFINKIRDHFRAEKTAAHGVIEVEIGEAEEATEEETNESSKPAMNVLRNVLDQMEDWQRILLLMRSQDVPYSEIARYVGKPEQQLKVYYARLKKQLAERVNQELKMLNQNNHLHGKQ